MPTAEYQQEWKKNNPEKSQSYSQRWRCANREKAAAASKAWKDRNPDKVHAAHLRRKYGIGMEDYSRMFLEQGGTCFLCHDKEHERMRLFVDHNHKTGKIRKLLCNKCNSMLGMVGERIELLERAIKYIKDHNG